MRQLFTLRFLAAIAAVGVLLIVLVQLFVRDDPIAVGDLADPPPVLHRIDFVDQVYATRQPDFAVADGAAQVDGELVLDGRRSLFVSSGTPGVDLCGELERVAACAVVADLLGEAVVWFALVPMGTAGTVTMPAIDTLDEGFATLVNGWQVPYAPILDRRCDNQEFTSYREFRDELDDGFVALYSIEQRRLVAVDCDARVDYSVPVASGSISDT